MTEFGRRAARNGAVVLMGLAMATWFWLVMSVGHTLAGTTGAIATGVVVGVLGVMLYTAIQDEPPRPEVGEEHLPHGNRPTAHPAAQRAHAARRRGVMRHGSPR